MDRTPDSSPIDLDDLELQTTEYLHAFIGDMMRLLAEHFGGETTINHLRVGNLIGQLTMFESRPTSNKEISETLGLSRPTVSRVVADFVDQGWVTEKPDPDDGRRRRLHIILNHPHADRFERAVRSRINELLERFEARDIVRVDPAKRSF